MNLSIKSFVTNIRDDFSLFVHRQKLRYWKFKDWCKYNANKHKYNLVKEALYGYPYDYADFLNLERYKFEEMLYYWQGLKQKADDEYTTEYYNGKITILKLLISLNKIISEDPEINNKFIAKSIYCNTRNAERFWDADSLDFVRRYCNLRKSLYEKKAKHLYYKILNNYIYQLWD